MHLSKRIFLPDTKKGRLSRPFVVMMGFGFFDLY